jgi:hypothetical protein
MVEETAAIVAKYYQNCSNPSCGHVRFSHKLFNDSCDALNCNCLKFEKAQETKTKIKKRARKKLKK